MFMFRLIRGHLMLNTTNIQKFDMWKSEINNQKLPPGVPPMQYENDTENELRNEKIEETP